MGGIIQREVFCNTYLCYTADLKIYIKTNEFRSFTIFYSYSKEFHVKKKKMQNSLVFVFDNCKKRRLYYRKQALDKQYSMADPENIT